MLRFIRSAPTLALALGALTLASPAVAASGSTHPGGLLVAEGPFGGRLEIVSHDVRVTIRDGIAVTTFEEVFRNTEDRELEALYTFPVPEGASVANFSMWIGGKEMVGEVVEKERARQIYDSYKRRGVDPGLLEQVDYTTFEMRVYPIPARAEQRVRVTYYQELDFDADRATYVYPLATTTDAGRADTRVHGRFSMELEVLSDIPVVELESPSHGADFVQVVHGPGYRQASLEQTGGDLARDVVLSFRTERERTGLDLVASTPPGEDGFFQLTLTAGDELEPDAQGVDYVFVSDVSGSMQHQGKLGLSAEALGAFLGVLGPEDRLQLINFNVRTERLFDGLVPVNEDSLGRARAFLDAQEAKGGTSLEPALELAYRHADPDRRLNVVILSDGLAEAEDQAGLVRSIQSRPVGSRVFCIGVGNDVHRPLLRQLATEAGGLADFVSHGDDFERRAKAFRRKLTRPAMEDVRLSFEGGDIAGLVPARLGNLFHGSPLRLYGRYGKAGTVRVKLSANLGGKPFEETLELELPGSDDDHPEIERMWAWHRIQELEASLRADAADDGTVQEIVLLSEGFSIPSRHASFLVLENDAEYERWKIARRNATRIDRDRAAQDRLRRKLDDLRQMAALPEPAQDSAAAETGAAPAASDPPATEPARSPARPGDLRVPRPGGGSVGALGFALMALLGALGLRRG